MGAAMGTEPDAVAGGAERIPDSGALAVTHVGCAENKTNAVRMVAAVDPCSHRVMSHSPFAHSAGARMSSPDVRTTLRHEMRFCSREFHSRSAGSSGGVCLGAKIILR